MNLEDIKLMKRDQLKDVANRRGLNVGKTEATEKLRDRVIEMAMTSQPMSPKEPAVAKPKPVKGEPATNEAIEEALEEYIARGLFMKIEEDGKVIRLKSGKLVESVNATVPMSILKRVADALLTRSV